MTMKTETTEKSCCAKIPLIPLGWALSIFFAITFVICIAFGILFPDLHPMGSVSSLGVFFPGFVWLSWSSFFLGLAESFAYGWYTALLFAPLYNYFVTRCKK